MSKLPKDAHPHYLPDQLRQTFPKLGQIYYLDAWPFMTLTLVVTSPATLKQITTDHVLPKFPAIKDFMYPLANGKDLVSMDGQEWKYWRTIFNPGFSAGHLMNLVPEMVKETAAFCDVLHSRAGTQSVFLMKHLTDNLAMDIIGKIILDLNLDCQKRSNSMVNALRRQMQWMAFGGEGNPFRQFHPLRPFLHWYNTRQMNRYIIPEVDSHFESQKVASISQKPPLEPDRSRPKSVVDLALAAYLNHKDSSNMACRIDPTFKETAINQLKLFLFSGHDTTSSTVCYVLYLLSANPHVLSYVRAEHDKVLGVETSLAAQRISDMPHLLNKLPYTAAVIKESMRLFPAASTTRTGEPSFTITDPRTGLNYPAEPGILIWLVSHACHHDPSFWPRSDEFLPERWLANEGEDLYVQRGAWRPFEHGPRAWIGKELSMLELKIVVCLVARNFDISTVYEEQHSQVKIGRQRCDIGRVGGERAYQVGKGEPSEFLPCKVKVRES
ncbi:MAG: hypothetical protein Q9201_002904 [Fulgogasparrea decipioides]